MKKIRLAIIIIIVCLMIAVLSACGNIADLINDKLDFKDYDEFKESTKNYSMTITNDNETTIIKVCENGYLYDNGTTIYFYNDLEKKGYLLDKSNNTGVVNTYESGDNLYDWETNSGIIDMLYSFQLIKLFMNQEGTGKIAGRDCTVYNYEQDGVKSKYWLDNEFGMCLKWENTEGGNTETMEVTEFTLGNVTISNMIDLSAYTVTDGSALPTKTVVSISVKNSTVPTNKTPSNLVLSDIKIIVIYDDETQEEKSLTSNMLNATDNNKLDAAGTHSVTVTYQGKSTTFSITLVETQKTVVSISVKSISIPFGSTIDNFVLSDIKIAVNYDDESEEEISLAESMLSSSDIDKLETAGTHDITVNYDGKTAAFTITLNETGPQSLPITDSIKDFYSIIALDISTASMGFMPIIAMNIATAEPYFKEYFDGSVYRRGDIDSWSAPNLLLDACFKILSYSQGVFDEEEIDFGNGVKKTPSCVSTSDGYALKYTEKKGLYSYWFETELKYDQATDSLSAEIYCGVNENQELKYIIEYNKTEDGSYMCLIRYPDEIVEGNPQSYTTLRLYFKGIAGKVSINRWQAEELSEADLIYEKTDNASYANDGDAIIATDGSAVTCPVDTLKSGFYDDFNTFYQAITANRESIFDEDLEEDKNTSYGNASESLIYTIEYIYAGDYTIYEIIKSYNNKVYLPINEDERLLVNRMGDTYVVTFENDYEEIIITVKYDPSGSFRIEQEVDGEIMLRFQWVKLGSEHFMEVLSNDYGTFAQYKYTFDTAGSTMKYVCIYEMEESIQLNIYKDESLTANVFASEPNAAVYPYYEYFSFASGALVYNYSFGEEDWGD